MSKKKFNWDDFPAVVESTKKKETEFDWNALPEAPVEISKVESALRGAAQGATFGFADELVGGAKALTDIALTDKSLADLGALYEKRRDESRQAFKAAEKANPGTFLAGNIGGAIATSLIPGVGIARGANAAQFIGRGAASGAAFGLGDSEAGDITSLAKDVATGTALGVGGGALGAGISSAAAKLPEAGKALERISKNQLLKELGGDKARFAKLGTKPKEIQKTKDLIINTVNKFGINVSDDADDIAARIAEKSDEIGKRIGRTIDEVDAIFPTAKVDLNKAINNLNEKYSKDLTLELNKNKLPIFQAVVNDLKSLGETPTLRQVKDVQEALNKASRQLVGNINEDAVFKREIYLEALNSLNNAIRENIDDAAKKIGRPDLSKNYREAITDYRGLKEADKLVTNKVRKEGNRSLGLTDAILAAGAFGAGGPLAAVGTLAATKAAEKATPMAAKKVLKIANLARNNPQFLEKIAAPLSAVTRKGSQAVGSTNYLLKGPQAAITSNQERIIPVSSVEMPEFEKRISNSQAMGAVEKAKRINLLKREGIFIND